MLLKKQINWRDVSRYRNINDETIIRFQDKIDWSELSLNKGLSIDIMDKFHDKIDWDYLLAPEIHEKMPMHFIEKYLDKLYWNNVLSYCKLNIEFIDKHESKINWNFLSVNKTLSVDIIKKYVNNLCIDIVAGCVNEHHYIPELDLIIVNIC